MTLDKGDQFIENCSLQAKVKCKCQRFRTEEGRGLSTDG